MRTPIRHATSLYLLTSLLAWFPMGAKGLVLCLEPNGRVVLEAWRDCCVARAAYSADNEAIGGFDVGPSSCGPCVDIQLGSAAARAVRTAVGVARPLPASLASVCPGELAALIISPPQLASSPRSNLRSTDSPIRTTILRN